MTSVRDGALHDFWSKDHRFGLRLRSSYIKNIASQCIKSYPNETGGILVGFYNQNLDCAEVTNVFFEPRDSQKGRTWFRRGIYGLQQRLNRLWLCQRYYLGEWHFHPEGLADPSCSDISQMFMIARSLETHCPEPILLIFSGKSTIQEFSCRAYIFSDDHFSELFSAD